MPSVFTIILTWNNFADTDECIQSLLSQTWQDSHVLVVDNGSTDGSRECLEAKWGEHVEFVENTVNLGCGAGYSTGMREALAQGADYVSIVDNDVVANPGFLRALVETLEADPGVGLVSPIVTMHHDPRRVWFAGGRYMPLLGLTRHEGLMEPLDLAKRGGRLRSSATDYAPSCAIMFSRRALEDVGLMDDRFFFGHDDVDWCLRARARGYKLRVLSECLALHKVSVTGGSRGSLAFTPFSAYHHALGSVLIGAKHAPGWRLLPYLAGQIGVRLPYYSYTMLRAGQWSGPLAYMRGLKDGASRYLLSRPSDAAQPAREIR